MYVSLGSLRRPSTEVYHYIAFCPQVGFILPFLRSSVPPFLRFRYGVDLTEGGLLHASKDTTRDTTGDTTNQTQGQGTGTTQGRRATQETKETLKETLEGKRALDEKGQHSVSGVGGAGREATLADMFLS